MRSAMPKNSEKIFYLNNFFQCIFQTATFSPVFYTFKRATHNLTQSWALFHVLYVIFKKIKNKKCTSYALFREVNFSRNINFSFAQFCFVLIEGVNKHITLNIVATLPQYCFAIFIIFANIPSWLINKYVTLKKYYWTRFPFFHCFYAWL